MLNYNCNVLKIIIIKQLLSDKVYMVIEILWGKLQINRINIIIDCKIIKVFKSET